MKIITILGARPQFIKAATVSKAIIEHNRAISSPSQFISEHIVHTGQHYDQNMSRIFFEEMLIPHPHINLGVGSGSHGKQTGEILTGIEKVLQKEKPDWVIVYGDTNSTLAGALAGCKLQIPVAHIEAGLRSFNRKMPEEHNRVLTDHCADLLFCPTQTAVMNLANEGITKGVYQVGDVMYDTIRQFFRIAEFKSNILKKLKLKPQEYYLATVHRPYNTDDPKALKEILETFFELDKPVVFPVHPRTQKRIHDNGLLANRKIPSSLLLLPPVGYLDMLSLQRNAQIILTDSGGMQKEAYFLGVRCLTLRSETEWPETVETGWNRLVPSKKSDILKALEHFPFPNAKPQVYGNGTAANQCLRILLKT